MPSRAEQSVDAQRHLCKTDPVMRALIQRVGPYTLRLERDRFRMLVRSIISQQISTSAARSIRQRLEQLTDPARPLPESLAMLSDAELRSAGISPQKLGYLRDLCSAVLEKRVVLDRIGRKPDEEVVAELIQIKGIGRWTAQMFLIFSLGRWDVLPHDDLGIRANIQDLYRLDELPDKSACIRIAEPWRPFASVASWYCWRNGDLKRKA